MKFKKLLATSATVTLSALALAACGSKNAGSDSQTLNWTDSAEIPTMDLSKATDATSFNQLNNVMEGLYRLGKDNKVEPGIAKSTKVSDDGLTYTFKLRKDAKWSNGDPVTAKDFVYSWQRTVDPKTGSQYVSLFDGIKNASDIADGKKPVSELGIKATDDHTLVVTLDKKIPYFKLLMGFPIFFPQNQKVVEQYGSKYGTASKYMVYDGPFKQTGWTGSNLNWKLQKNNNYWDKKSVKLNTINYQVNKSPNTSYNLYQSNKLDASPLSNEQAKQLKGKKGYLERVGASTFMLAFNTEKSDFANADVRRGISMAINRKEFANNVLGGGTVPADTITAKGLVKVGNKDYTAGVAGNKFAQFNKAEAKKYLDKGLKELGKDKLEFTILSDDTDNAKKSTEFLQSQIQTAFGNKVKVKTQNVPFKTRLSRQSSGDFEVSIYGWGADFADPISFLDLFTSDNAQNLAKWKNADYDKLIAASKTESDVNKRFKDLQDAETIFLNEDGLSPLYYQVTPWVVNEKVKGIVYNSAGANYNFKDAYIAK